MHIKTIGQNLIDLGENDAAKIEQVIKGYIADQSLKMGQIMPIMRIGICGTMQGPDLIQTVALIGVEEAGNRLIKSVEVFDKLVKRSYRVSNISDLVTLAPLPVMPNKDVFCHVGTTTSFQKNLGDYRDNNTLAYIQMYNIPFSELPPMKQQ